LIQAIKRLGVPAAVVRDQDEAEALITLRTYYRSRQAPILDAESRGLPIYVLRANTVTQMEHSLAEMFNLKTETPEENWDAIELMTQQAIQSVLNGQRWADLQPASATIRRLQHELARQSDLISHSHGKDPNRRVRIFRD
jgi:hypothetical protein